MLASNEDFAVILQPLVITRKRNNQWSQEEQDRQNSDTSSPMIVHIIFKKNKNTTSTNIKQQTTYKIVFKNLKKHTTNIYNKHLASLYRGHTTIRKIVLFNLLLFFFIAHQHYLLIPKAGQQFCLSCFKYPKLFYHK